MTVTVAAYERKHRETLLNLIFYSRFTHQHLDWYKIGQWLDMDRSLIRIAYDASSGLAGFIGVSEPLHGASWLRVVALENYADPQAILSPLWDSIRQELIMRGVHQVAILITNQWIIEPLELFGFRYQEDVVTLQRIGTDLPVMPDHDFNVINAYENELPVITAIDHAAFSAPWQMTADDLRQAQRQAASCTVALASGVPVGYQISTRHHTAGHLARLAVRPDWQGQRIGAVLLHHLIDRFNQRGIRSVTVNTQMSNIRSQHLYERFGFHRNGFDLPVWLAEI